MYSFWPESTEKEFFNNQVTEFWLETKIIYHEGALLAGCYFNNNIHTTICRYDYSYRAKKRRGSSCIRWLVLLSKNVRIGLKSLLIMLTWSWTIFSYEIDQHYLFTTCLVAQQSRKIQFYLDYTTNTNRHHAYDRKRFYEVTPEERLRLPIYRT